MTLTISLTREMEESLRNDAEQERRSIEDIASRRLQEAELLRRIFSYFPAEETQELRALARKRRNNALPAGEAERYTALARYREARNAERLADLIALARLRGETVRRVMTQLGIRPYRIS